MFIKYWWQSFTISADSLYPEENFALMDQTFEILIHKVNDYQGSVDELRRHGILVF